VGSEMCIRDSPQVVLRNPFGATLCKMLYQCQACGEVFEAFKTV